MSLAVIRGFSSKTFLWENAQAIDAAGKDAYLFFLGDHDEAGDRIIKTACENIRRYARTRHKIYWEKIAVTPEQIDQFNLPTRPSKTAGARYVDGCVEVDAIPPETLRELIRDAITPHIDEAELRVIEAAEKSERELMQRIAGNLSAIRRTLGTA